MTFLLESAVLKRRDKIFYSIIITRMHLFFFIIATAFEKTNMVRRITLIYDLFFIIYRVIFRINFVVFYVITYLQVL